MHTQQSWLMQALPAQLWLDWKTAWELEQTAHQVSSRAEPLILGRHASATAAVLAPECMCHKQGRALSSRVSRGSAILRMSHHRHWPSEDTLISSEPVLDCSQAKS